MATMARSLRLAILVIPAVVGCHGDSELLYPVAGKITLDDQPFTAATTTVLFKPDAARGNTSRVEPVGMVDSNGTYILYSNQRNGSPPGWYKVLVTATSDDQIKRRAGARALRPSPQTLLPAKYGSPDTTPLAIEVVPSSAAGAYDLKLKKTPTR
jgi:hypothetical protein